jgi:hypothetical protein
MKKKYCDLTPERVKMFFFKPLVMFLLQSLANHVNAQKPLPCGGYTINFEAIKKAVDFETHGIGGIQNSTYQVRVYFTVLTNDDGSNAAATSAQLATEFSTLVADYSAANICFILAGTNYVPSTKLNINFNVDTDPKSLFDQYRVPGCINIFYTQKISGTNTSCNGGTCGIGGIAFYLPGTICLVANGNIGWRHTISHETGHCLGLLHTFEPANGYEDIDGSNSATSADLITDTQADPYAYSLGNFSCFSVSPNQCSYTGNCTDPKGNPNFSPPYSNTMGYWGTNSCYPSFSFTNGQFSRAESFLSTNGDLMNCSSSTSALTEGPGVNVVSGYLFATTTNTLSTTGSVNITGPAIATFSGQTVSLEPGFDGHPSGSGYIDVQSSSCNSAFVKNSANNNMNHIEKTTNQKNELLVYPNPTASAIHIEFKTFANENNAVLKIYSLQMQQVKQFRYDVLPNGMQDITVDLGNLASGPYYLIIRLHSRQLITKLLVIK